jgi:uncharacterized protein YhfF
VSGAVPAHLAPFWRAFAATRRADPTPRFLEAFHFDDHAESADALGALVLVGRKRATAALLWTHEAAGTQPPAPADLSIVTDFAGTPLCVIETTRAHEAFFARECARIGRVPQPDMPVVCERFEVVFVPADAATAG